MTISGQITILSVIRSRGRSIGDWLNIVSVFSISVVDFLANLLGESQINSLASRSSKLGDALLMDLNIIHDLWDSDALLGSEVLTADNNQVDGLVDTGLDWLRVGNLNSWLNRGDNRDIVASFLGNLLAVVVSIAVVSVSWCWLANGHHLGVTLLLVRNFNSLGSCGFSLLLVRVCADLIVDNGHTLGTDSTGDWVALLSVNDDLGRDLNIFTDSLESRGANLSRFNNIYNRAVVLLLIMRLVVSWSWDMVGWSMVDCMVNWGMVDSMVDSMVDWGMDGMVNNRGMDCMVNNRGMDSMVHNWGMDSMVHKRGMVSNWGMYSSWGMGYKGTTCKSSKWNLCISRYKKNKSSQNKNLKKVNDI
jgi:hypothetical protein